MITTETNTELGTLVVDLLVTIFPLALFLSLAVYRRSLLFIKNVNLVSKT